jgi:hypothetical protein
MKIQTPVSRFKKSGTSRAEEVGETRGNDSYANRWREKRSMAIVLSAIHDPD